MNLAIPHKPKPKLDLQNNMELWINMIMVLGDSFLKLTLLKGGTN